MELIRTLTQMVHSLRARGIRRRVAVVCPKDSHTEYVIIRALREEIAEFYWCLIRQIWKWRIITYGLTGFCTSL